MMRITEHKRRFGLVAFAALLAVAFSLLTSVNHPAYAAPAGVSGCGTQVNNVQSGSFSNYVFHGNTNVGIAYVNIDFLDNNTTGRYCSMRARADVFPSQGHSLSGGFRVELCFNTPAVYGCEMGGLTEVISGSQSSYTCPTVSYPNHCAIVGPWVAPSNYFCPSSVDAGVFATNTNSLAESYAWLNNWC